MKYVDEYRDKRLVRALAGKIREVTTRPWTLMEICGGQTHAILRYSLDEILPEQITLVHGPGCPVCVTPVEMIDNAVVLSSLPGLVMTSFGDMMRVPGTDMDLLSGKAAGADVRMVYSPLDALRIAVENPGNEVVFFAVGFETTAPANALAVKTAADRKIGNFSILCAHVLVPPAIHLLLSAPGNAVQAFLAAGHVCTIMGYEEYIPLAGKFRVPIVVTGFEPVDILQGILMAVQQLEGGRHEVENAYGRAVTREGNTAAQQLLREVFETTDREWRGMGTIPQSGYRLREKYAAFDAEKRFSLPAGKTRENILCIAGDILQGKKKPVDCPAFGRECTPDRPLGAPMVSNEGACSAYYRYKKL